jgi:hypothetical protein
VTNVVPSAARPATRWRNVVSRARARDIAYGRVATAGPASTCPPRGPSRTFVPSPAAPRPGDGLRLRGRLRDVPDGASRRGADAIGPQIESRCSAPIARLREVRQPPCSVRIDLKADLTRLRATARLLLCTRSCRRPQRPCDRFQHHSQAGVGQERPPGGHGPAAPHNASAGEDDWVTAREGHPRGFAPPACRRSEEMTMARHRGPLARAQFAGEQSAGRAVRETHAGRHRATGEESPPAFPASLRPVTETLEEDPWEQCHRTGGAKP